MIAENKQDDEVLDENIYYDAAEEEDTKLEENTVIDTKEGNSKAKKTTEIT